MSVNSRLKDTKIISQRKAFYKLRIPKSSCTRKETVENILCMMYKSMLSFLLNKNMKPTFKYNGNAKHSIKDLKGEYTGNDFSIM